MGKVLIEESSMTNIGDTIREIMHSSNTFLPSEMPDAIRDIPYYYNFDFNNIDEDKNWVKPEEWPDIEAIDFGSDYMAYLFDNRTDYCYCGLTTTVSTGDVKYQIGTIVEGEFIETHSEIIESAVAFSINIHTFIDYSDYAVVLVTANSPSAGITDIVHSNAVIDGVTYPHANMPMLWRTGKLPRISTMPLGSNLFIERDYIKEAGALTSLASYASGCYFLKSHHRGNWVTANVTTCASMFNGCYALVDFDSDFSGYFESGSLTTVATMFNGCYGYRGSINVTGWNMTSVTTMSNLFNNCYNITQIIGIEDWYLPKCYNFAGTSSSGPTFGNCYSLYQNEEGLLDLSNWHRGLTAAPATTSVTFASMFTYCNRLKCIDISTLQMQYATSCASMFAYATQLEEIKLPTGKMIGWGASGGTKSVLTTVASMFARCYSLKKIDVSNISLSKVTNIGSLFTYCFSLKQITYPTTAPVFGSSTGYIGSPFTYCHSLDTIDCSWFAANKATNATSQVEALVRYIPNLIHWYPPTSIDHTINLSYVPHLSLESLQRFFDNLIAPKSNAAVKEITFGAPNFAKLTDEQKAKMDTLGWTYVA